MILLNQNLTAFLAVVESLTISAAAKTLGLTQTGTTQRIKSLERELGVTLFLRSRSGMKLTGEGATLLRHCTQLQEIEGRVISELQQKGVEHEVDIAITGPGGLIARRVIPQCAKVSERWPKLNFRFISTSHADRIDLLKRGVADLAIVMDHEVKNELDSKVIAPNEMILVAAHRWRDRKLSEILRSERLIAYNAEDSLALDYLKEFELTKHLGRPRILANENEMILSLVQHGKGFALLPKELVSGLIEQKSLTALNGGRSLKISFALTWYPRSPMPGYFKDLIAAIR
jgi:DNA-binding transcriptional LysR family regulator